MNLLDLGLMPIKRLRRASAKPCFVCQRRIKPAEDRLRIRDDIVVHRACATYRMRNHRGYDSLGFPR